MINAMFQTNSCRFMTKTYVSVIVEFDEEGNKRPKEIRLNDQTFEVLRVLKVVNAASLKVGGIGERYTVKIGTHETFLFFEKETGKWFVELK